MFKGIKPYEEFAYEYLVKKSCKKCPKFTGDAHDFENCGHRSPIRHSCPPDLNTVIPYDVMTDSIELYFAQTWSAV